MLERVWGQKEQERQLSTIKKAQVNATTTFAGCEFFFVQWSDTRITVQFDSFTFVRQYYYYYYYYYDNRELRYLVEFVYSLFNECCAGGGKPHAMHLYNTDNARLSVTTTFHAFSAVRQSEFITCLFIQLKCYLPWRIRACISSLPLPLSKVGLTEWSNRFGSCTRLFFHSYRVSF